MANLLLSGTLVTAGGLPAAGRFNYGLTAALGTFTRFQGPLVDGQTFTDVIRNLPGQVLVFYRAEAQNALGLVVGATRSIRTTLSLVGTVQPACATLAADEVGSGSAQLNGTVIDDMGIGVEASFEWGATPAYGEETPWVSGFTTGMTFSDELSVLRQGGAYHYRARVRNRFGIGFGGNVSFNTLEDVGSRTGLPMELALLSLEEI